MGRQGDRWPELPPWPRWKLAGDGRACAVIGRHLTAGRARLAQVAGKWIAIAGLVFLAWYCWGFHNIPVWLQQVAFAVLHWLWGQGWQVKSPALVIDAVYLAAWVACWLLRPLWRRLIAAALSPLLWRRTAITFTADRIFVLRRFRRPVLFDRHAVTPLTFVLQQDPELHWREAKNHPPAVITFYRQTRFLLLQYGAIQVPLTSFGALRDGERFVQVCHLALSYPLDPPVTAAANGGLKMFEWPKTIDGRGVITVTGRHQTPGRQSFGYGLTTLAGLGVIVHACFASSSPVNVALVNLAKVIEPQWDWHTVNGWWAFIQFVLGWSSWGSASTDRTTCSGGSCRRGRR